MAQATAKDKCDICRTEDDVKYYCIDCDKILCSKCLFYFHINGKRTKNDEIVLLQEARAKHLLRTPVAYCNDHTIEEVTLWCNNCEKFICRVCLTGNHNTHNISKLEDIVEAKTKELMNIKQILTDRKAVFQKAFDTQGNTHSEYIKSMEKLKTEITDQKSKIIEMLNIVCDRHFSEISLLLQKEHERYTDACTNIQEKNQAISSALLSVQNTIDSKHPANIIKVTKDGNQLIRQGPTQPNSSEVTTTRFLPTDVDQEVILQILGGLHTECKGVIPKQSNVTPATKQRGIVVSDVKIKPTIKVKDKTGSIAVIVPMSGITFWVAVRHDQHLLLINHNGDIIRESMSLSNDIDDAKKYKKDLLVTCCKPQIVKLSPDGRKKTLFADMSPYYPSGLCVTSELDVLVCVHSQHRKDEYGKVCRLGTTGEILQTIETDQTGALLYGWLISITSLPSGEIITTGDNRKVVVVDEHGQHLFTWSGEMESGQTNKLGAMHITHDKYNNLIIADYMHHKVYTLKKDKAKGKSLLDSTHEIQNPSGLAVHPTTGNVLVGCKSGKILVIDY